MAMSGGGVTPGAPKQRKPGLGQMPIKNGFGKGPRMGFDDGPRLGRKIPGGQFSKPGSGNRMPSPDDGNAINGAIQRRLSASKTKQ